MTMCPSIACGPALPPLETPSLTHAFAATAAAHAARTAVIDGGRRLDYATLDRASDALAATLAAAGVAPGDRVGLRLDRSAEAVIATLAILKCGAACVPFDPAAPEQRHATQATSAELRALLIAEVAAAPVWFEGPALPVVVDSDAPPSRHLLPPDILPPITADDIAYVLHTSGSTGEPKGTCLTHRGLLDLFRGMSEHMTVRPGDTVHHGMSIAFDGAVFELWLALIHGAAISVLPPGASSTTLCTLAERNAVSAMLLTTGLFNTLTDDVVRRLARVDTLLVGGDVLAPAAAARYLASGGRLLINAYGPTEVTVFSHLHALRAGDVVEAPVPIGRPLANMSAYVLDDARRPVPVGAEGELYIGGSGVGQGYLARPALTAERFLPDPFADDGAHAARMYRSGDLVRQREDGLLEFLGRIDTQVKINGFRVELDEIERTLCDLGGLLAACVVHAKNVAGLSQLHAFAVPGDGAPVDPDALIDRLRTRLPAYMVPRTLRVIERLPLTLNGKVDRRALLAGCETTGNAPTAPVTPAGIGDAGTGDAQHRALLALLAECLGVPTVADDDNFYDVGGDSLSAMRFCAFVAQAHGVDLPMAVLFEAETLGEVVAHIADTVRSGETACP